MNDFNVNDFVVSFCEDDENKISDRVTIPNILLLDCYDLVSIVLRKRCNIFIQFTQEHSKEYLDILYLRIEQTNSILRSLGNLNYVIISKNNSSLQIDDSQPQEMPQFSEDFNENVALLLNKLDVLKISIKLCCEDLPITELQTDENSIFFNKDIDASLCDNCGDCVQYCPTHALQYNEHKNRIFFTSGKCIGCDLCNQVCQCNAIVKNTHVDLIEFAFDRTLKKIDFETTKQI